MIALYIILGIIIFFAAVLSIRAHIHAEYEDGKELIVFAKWAFLKIPILPSPEKQPKEKKKKETAPAADAPPAEEAKTDEAPKAKGPNPLKNIYENEQLEGILGLFRKLIELLDKFGRRIVHSFVIDELFLDVDVTRGDAAQTAESYGKMCQKIFPVTGALVANCDVRRYSINVEPDYIAKPGTRVAFSAEISLNPRKLINAVLLFAFGAVFKLGIRLIKDLKPKNPQPAEAKEEKPVETAVATEPENVNNTESGVL